MDSRTVIDTKPLNLKSIKQDSTYQIESVHLLDFHARIPKAEKFLEWTMMPPRTKQNYQAAMLPESHQKKGSFQLFRWLALEYSKATRLNQAAMVSCHLTEVVGELLMELTLE